jgi:type II secretory pathway component GspD/PulD (secretin)
MNNGLKKIIATGFPLASLIFTGCFTQPNPQNPLEIQDSNGITNDEINGNMLKNENPRNSFLNMVKQNEDDSYLSADDIIKIVDAGDTPPVSLTSKRIDRMEMYSAKLGDVLRLILTDIKISLTVEPNVELNTPVNISISNKSIWESLKQVCESAGYNIYYDARKKSLILTPYVKRKYYVPAEIFVKRQVSIGFAKGGDAGGSVSPSFDINPSDPMEILKNTLDMVGSKDKIVSIDAQSGVIYLKERPNYIKEDDDAIKTFVQERSMQFEVQLVVAEMNLNQVKKFGMDIANINKDKFNISSLGGTTIDDSTVGDIIQQGGVVISGFSNYTGLAGVNPLKASDLAFKAMLASFKTMDNVQIVERPNVVVQNHQV